MKSISSAAVVMTLKASSSALQFLLLVLTARWFGVEFRGEIALFNAAANLYVLAVGFTGGASIVFLSARDPSRATLTRLLAITYTFCVVVPVLLEWLASLLGHSSRGASLMVVLVAVMNALLVVNVYVMMSSRAVWRATLLEFMRPFCLCALVVAVAALRGFRTPHELYVVWGVAASVAFVISVPFVIGHVRSLPPRGASVATARHLLRDLLGMGFLAQASNLAQFLNYRSLFFALERSAGVAAVGLFSTAVSLAEVLWIPSNSLAAVTLNRITRLRSAPETRPFVMHMTRLALAATLVAATVAAVIPAGWITALLGRDFGAVRGLLVTLLPGVIAIGVAVIASAYNAGHGLYLKNLMASLSGLLVTSLGFFVLVPRFAMGGAIVAMNASYIATSAILIVGLAMRERVRLDEFVPRAADLSPSATGMP